MRKFNPEKELYKIQHGNRNKVIFTIIFGIILVTIGYSFALYQVRYSKRIIYTKVANFSRDLNLAVYLDGEKQTEFPTKRDDIIYTSIDCNDNKVSASWNYDKWGLEIFSKLPNKCNVYFETRYKDKSGASYPELYQGMIPITIGNNGELTVAKVSEEWYNYDKHNWANAVLLDNNKIKDKSPNQANATYTGAKVGNGEAVLDGMDDYINCGYANYNFGNAFSTVVRFKLNDEPTKQGYIIGNAESAGINVGVRETKKFYYGIYDPSTKSYVASLSVENMELEVNKWYEIALIYNGSELKLYVNNKLIDKIDTGVPKNMMVSSEPFYLGANPNYNGHQEESNITVNKAMVYHRVLTEGEIDKIYQNQEIENKEGLLFDLDFENEYHPEYKAEETINMNDVAQMYVWIPRYKYKLWNVLNGESNPFAIEIEFESNTTGRSMGTNNGQWYTHPAFLFGDTELNGFWVGKFEPSDAEDSIGRSSDIGEITILPGKTSMVMKVFKKMFDAEQRLSDEGNKYNLDSNEVDTRPMKNMEWGAVAYLTSSKYGRYENNGDPISSGAEVWINNTVQGIDNTKMGGTYTGCVGDSADAAVEWNNNDNAPATCKESNRWNKMGVNASTTGNMYGIYDMAGGAWELVMGVIKEQDSDTPYWNTSGFIESPPESKYYDLYEFDNNFLTHERGHLGDATREILQKSGTANGGWMGNNSQFPADYSGSSSKTLPWFERGSRCDDPYAGIFAFNWHVGSGGAAQTIRPVLSHE